jgi:hypothetical protein
MMPRHALARMNDGGGKVDLSLRPLAKPHGLPRTSAELGIEDQGLQDGPLAVGQIGRIRLATFVTIVPCVRYID